MICIYSAISPHLNTAITEPEQQMVFSQHCPTRHGSQTEHQKSSDVLRAYPKSSHKDAMFNALCPFHCQGECFFSIHVGGKSEDTAKRTGEIRFFAFFGGLRNHVQAEDRKAKSE